MHHENSVIHSHTGHSAALGDLFLCDVPMERFAERVTGSLAEPCSLCGRSALFDTILQMPFGRVCSAS